MFPIRKKRILIITTLVAALACLPSAALAAPPDLDTGTWLAPLQQRLSLWLSGLFGDAPADEPDAIWEEVGCGADPDGTPCSSTTVDPAPTVGNCDRAAGAACGIVPVL
jgi:hypothetical protein